MRNVMLAVVALMTASAAHAGEASELSCIAKGYTAEQRADLDALLPEMANGSSDNEALRLIVTASASRCEEKFSWGEHESALAWLNECGRLFVLSQRRHGGLSAKELARIDSGLAKGDRYALWKVLEDQYITWMQGVEVTVSDENAAVLDAFVTKAELGVDDETSEQVHAYLFAKVWQRSTARDFSRQM